MRRGKQEVPVKDEQCLRSKLRKPKSQRLCQRVACDFIWQEGTWSEVLILIFQTLRQQCYNRTCYYAQFYKDFTALNKKHMKAKLSFTRTRMLYIQQEGIMILSINN